MSTSRQQVQRLISELPYEAIPEMVPPLHTISVKAPVGYIRDLDMREDAPYFNASVYCNKLGLRFSVWLRQPTTTALIKALHTYYREAVHERPPSLVMLVKGGARIVRGYYVHTMLHDALSSWCDFELRPPESRPRMPLPNQRSFPTFIYTAHTVIDPGTSPEAIAAAQAGIQARMQAVISAARGSMYPQNA